MGYHVILNSKEKFETLYVERYEDLFYLKLSKESVIYQGEKEWLPKKVGSSEYMDLLDPKKIAGFKAEKLFYEMALGIYILEPIEQDQASFHRYKLKSEKFFKNDEFSVVKRGDFLIRDVYNIEVDVKCRTFKNRTFRLNYADIMMHERMQEISATPVIFAIYKRKGNSPVEEQLYSISNFKIRRLLKEGTIKTLKDKSGVIYVNISLDYCRKGFGTIEHFKDKMKIKIED